MVFPVSPETGAAPSPQRKRVRHGDRKAQCRLPRSPGPRHACVVPPEPKRDLRLPEDDLPDVVEEAAHLADERGRTLGRAQVAEVLAEVDLPADLVDEAHDRVLAKRAEARDRKRKRVLLGTLLTGTLAFGLAVAVWSSGRAATMANITAQSGQLSLGAPAEGGRATSAFRAVDRPDVFYTVTLTNAPTGQTLDVRCDYRDPSGSVARQITYTTKTIKTPVWETHGHYVLPAAAPAGAWSVEMTVENNALRREQFHVE